MCPPDGYPAGRHTRRPLHTLIPCPHPHTIDNPQSTLKALIGLWDMWEKWGYCYNSKRFSNQNSAALNPESSGKYAYTC